MVNTRAKLKKTQNIRKLCFTEASMADFDHRSTESGTLIGSNDDLLTEILRWLPVTSILRFKSVSKHWQSLLSHRRFTLTYNNASTSPGFFLRNLYIPFDDQNKNVPPFRKLDFYPDLCGIRIVQSCNGLLLCCSDRGNERDRKYYVFNPTTKQFVVIPTVPGGRDVRKNVQFMGLAFHQTDCEHYKVVCIHRSKLDKQCFQIQIYSSEIGKWKISDQSFSTPYYTSFGTGVYWNGAIYWPPSCLNPLYFRLDVGQVRTLPLPETLASFGGYYDGARPLYFGESGGHLHLVEKADRESHLCLNLYELSRDHSGWFVKYQVELDELPGAYPDMINSYLPPSSPYYYKFDVVDVIRGKKEEESFMVIIIPGKVIMYNLVDKSFKQFFDLSIISYFYPHQHIHRYIEALGSF